MEGGTASVWSYQQDIEELKHALMFTTLELEATKMAVEEEKRKNEETEKQLLQLLKAAFHERDEAKNQLQLLLNNIVQSNSTEFLHVAPNLSPESAALVPQKGNSTTTESDSLSETTYNRHSLLSSSLVESIFDAVSSPELSNTNVTDSRAILMPIQPFSHENKASYYNGVSSRVANIDPALATIDLLVMKKPLPEKGKLLQAVIDAGPLLQTLLIAGPLPQWRNPPPPLSSQVPPVSIRGADGAIFRKPFVNSIYSAQSSNEPYHQTSNGASLFCSAAMPNPSPMKRPLLSYCGDERITGDSAKHQRFY